MGKTSGATVTSKSRAKATDNKKVEEKNKTNEPKNEEAKEEVRDESKEDAAAAKKKSK